MDKVMYACNLESRPRWINLGRSKSHNCNLHCSNCGETIHHRKAPTICPSCKEKMKNGGVYYG